MTEGRRRRCSGFLFFGVFWGDPEGVLIWSGRSAVFGFVQVCSALFRFVRGVLVGLTAQVDAGSVGLAGAVLLGFGVGRGLTVATLVNPWQPGVNRCQHLAACGKRMVAGSVGEGASASLWGERHRAALLF